MNIGEITSTHMVVSLFCIYLSLCFIVWIWVHFKDPNGHHDIKFGYAIIPQLSGSQVFYLVEGVAYYPSFPMLCKKLDYFKTREEAQKFIDNLESSKP